VELRRCAALWVLLVAAASGCRTPVPEAVLLPAGDPRPERLLAAWSRSAESRHGLRGRARLAVDGADGALKLRGQERVALERPARLRVEILGLLGQTVAVLVTDGDRYELLRADDRSYQSGEVHPNLLWEQAWIALTPEETIDLLLGAPALDPRLSPASAWTDADGRIRLELVDDDGNVRRWASFDAAGRLERLEVFEADGRRRYRAAYGDWAPVSGVPFAHEVVLDVDAGGTHAVVELRDVELNPVLPPELFRLRAPVSAGVAPGEGE
jgi:hypothetical protein